MPVKNVLWTVQRRFLTSSDACDRSVLGRRWAGVVSRLRKAKRCYVMNGEETYLFVWDILYRD